MLRPSTFDQVLLVLQLEIGSCTRFARKRCQWNQSIDPCKVCFVKVVWYLKMTYQKDLLIVGQCLLLMRRFRRSRFRLKHKGGGLEVCETLSSCKPFFVGISAPTYTTTMRVHQKYSKRYPNPTSYKMLDRYITCIYCIYLHQ